MQVTCPLARSLHVLDGCSSLAKDYCPMTRALELGIFLPNAKGGGIMATGEPPQYFPTWELNKKNSLVAEAAGFDFLLSMVKWRVSGGSKTHWDYPLDSSPLMPAVAAVRSRIQLNAPVAIQ